MYESLMSYLPLRTSDATCRIRIGVADSLVPLAGRFGAERSLRGNCLNHNHVSVGWGCHGGVLYKGNDVRHNTNNPRAYGLSALENLIYFILGVEPDCALEKSGDLLVLLCYTYRINCSSLDTCRD